MNTIDGPQTHMERPNVLFVLADRMRFCDVGLMGDCCVRTPNLDRLAAQGVVVEHAFSSLPICGPARASLLTGQYPVTHGVIANDVRLPDTAVTLSQTFADSGYRTGFVGKWHLDWLPRKPGFIPPGPARHGFGFWAAHECDHDYHGGSYFRDTPEAIRFRRYAPKEETDLAIEFMREGDNRPFFLTLAFGIPHMSIPKAPQTEEEYRDLYAAAEIPFRDNVPDYAQAEAQDYLRHYYGMVTVLDDQVGRLLATPDELGIANNTIVCFCADHGDLIGSQGVVGLQLPWDECVRVPFAVRWPGHIPGGRRLNTFLNLPDVMPTLLSLCGIGVPSSVQGRSLDRSLLREGGDEADSVFLGDAFPCHQRYGHEPWRAIRTRQWLYARYPDRPWLLYDMESDPYQLRNLCDSGNHTGIRDELEELLRVRLAKLDDPFLGREALEQRLLAASPRVLESVRMGWQPGKALHPRHLPVPISAELARDVSFW